MKIEQTDIADLLPDPDNARLHDKKNLDAIKASLEAFGQRKPIVIADGIVVAGNGTLEAAQALGWTTIATVSADDLTPEQRTAFAIADNRTAELAAWDDTKLAQALAHVTEDGDELGEATGFDHETLLSLVAGEAAPEEVYTRKMEPPIYKATGDCPDVPDLYDDARYAEIVSTVQGTGLPEDVQRFLTMAATRHIVFDYQDIAEYYCHASPEVQALMEDSALVIIDFDRAVELGYVHVCTRLRELAGTALEAKGQKGQEG